MGLKPRIKDVKNTGFIVNDSIMGPLIRKNPKNLRYYRGSNQSIIDDALNTGWLPNAKVLKNNLKLAKNEALMYRLIDKDPRNVRFYVGSNEELINYAVKKGYIPTINDIKKSSSLKRNDEVMRKIIEKDASAIIFYRGNNQDLIDLAIENGYVPTKEDVKKNPLLARNKAITEMLLKDNITNLNLYKKLDDDVIVQALQIFENCYNINIPDYYSDVFKVYKGDLSKFCFNYNVFSKFLFDLGVSEDLFLKYGFSNSYDWLDDMINIVSSNHVESFKQFKDFFVDNFNPVDDKHQDASDITLFLTILKNYSKFPDLCRDMIRRNQPLTREEKANINMIFSLSNVFDDTNKPRSVKDVGQAVLNIKEVYRDKLNKSINSGLDVMKDTLCGLLFDTDQKGIRERLDIYGDTEVLRQLLFNNRNHPEIQSHIRKMMISTSLMEDILAINDPKILKGIITNILDNFEEFLKLSSRLSNYEDKMRYLYELDIQSNLTKVSSIKNLELVIDKEKTEKYGVEVIDFSNKKYCLLTHVMSERESPNELISGKVEGKKNFICLSSISNRNQVYYTNPDENQIIFATDVLPNSLFLMSSTSNMSSNHYINGTEVYDIPRAQRGIVETSHAPYGNNSEILTYRDDLKFSYIVLPGGREPTENELSLARKYGLKFVVTQGVRETIKNPVELETKRVEAEKTYKEEEKETISVGADVFERTNKLRSIAILTDSHGLFEPTLAVLEDARKRGITEIYSLGDNIGTGPNPREVLELLDEYGVTSLLGNHELYISLGIDNFKDHLDAAGPGAYQAAKENSSWTAEQLTEEQKQRLRMCPKMKELVLGGKKILLCHDVKDFNTGEIIVDTSVYEEVFRGHDHFQRKDNNITTLPGVGVGTNVGKATYLVLTEKEGGGYTSEIVTVSYDKDNMRYGIIESSMSDAEKDKIAGWAGVTDGAKKR